MTKFEANRFLISGFLLAGFRCTRNLIQSPASTSFDLRMFLFSIRSEFLDKSQTCRGFYSLHCCIWEHGRSFASSKLFFVGYCVQNSVLPLRKESTSGWENSGFYDDHSKLLLIKSRNFPKHFTRYNPQSVLLGCDGTAGYLICFISAVFFPLGGNFAVTTRLGGILLLLLQLICATC